MKMSKIDNLIKQYCPNGVEYKTIKEIAEIGTGSSNRVDANKDGLYPFFVRSKDVLKINDFEFDEEAIIIPGEGGIGDIFHYIKGKYALHQRAYRIHFFIKELNVKFAYYYMIAQFKSFIFSKAVNATVTSIRKPMIEKFKLPIPPLPVQEEIVKVLDAFTALEAELEAELEARKRQYEYYRNKLLTFNENTTGGGKIKFMQLGDVGTFIRGNGLQKKDFTDTGVGCIHYGQIYTYYGTFAERTKSYVSNELAEKLKKARTGDLIIATTSENVEDVGKAVAWLGDENICISGDAFIYHHNQNPKYMSYLFQTNSFFEQKKKCITGVKVMRINDVAMSKFKFGFPPIEEQERIVAILDKFDSLVNDISEGLPAELTARRQQYEYYRNKLLTFDEAA